MKFLAIVGFVLVAACSSTPQTEAHFIASDARLEHREWKAWCLANHGVVVEDDVYGRKCYRTADFRLAVQRSSLGLASQ